MQRRQFTDQSHFFVFAQNSVGFSPGVQISTSLIVGMKQGKEKKYIEILHKSFAISSIVIH